MATVLVQCIQFGAGLRHADAGLEACSGAHEPRVRVLYHTWRKLRDEDEDLGIVADLYTVKLRLHHADNGVGPVVEPDDFAERAWVGREVSGQIVVADDADQAQSASPFIVGGEYPARSGMHAERRKIRTRDLDAAGGFGLTLNAHLQRVDGREAEDALIGIGVAGEIAVLRIAEGAGGGAGLALRGPPHHLLPRFYP